MSSWLNDLAAQLGAPGPQNQMSAFTQEELTRILTWNAIHMTRLNVPLRPRPDTRREEVYRGMLEEGTMRTVHEMLFAEDLSNEMVWQRFRDLLARLPTIDTVKIQEMCLHLLMHSVVWSKANYEQYCESNVKQAAMLAFLTMANIAIQM